MRTQDPRVHKCQFSAFFAGLLAVVFFLSFRGGLRPEAGGTLRDIDGNEYRIVQIGSQIWMAEDLRVTRTPDGSPVSSHFPNDDSSNASTHGLLYDWKTALRISPKGWHLTSDEEWRTLEEYLGDNAGGKLKDTAYWKTPNISATNKTGFTARAAGYWNDGGFDNVFGARAVFWSSTKQDTHFVFSRTLSADHGELRRAPQHPQYGFSVRCIKDN